jgi:hypothetical protein
LSCLSIRREDRIIYVHEKVGWVGRGTRKRVGRERKVIWRERERGEDIMVIMRRVKEENEIERKTLQDFWVSVFHS